MKKTILFSAMLIFGINSYAQTTYLTEDFNDGMPSGWGVYHWSGECDWQLSSDMPTGDDFPTQAVIFNDDACGEGAPSSAAMLYTRKFNLAASTSATLTVDVAFQDYEDELMTIEVWDSQNQLATLATFVDDLDPNIQTFEFDVTPYMTECTIFRFFYSDDNDGDGIGNWGWGAGIDNFLLTVMGPLGTDDYTLSGLSVYPNPTTDILRVTANSEIQFVEVYDVVGRQVLRTAFDNQLNEINTSQLAKGAYILKAISGSAQSTIKFLKN